MSEKEQPTYTIDELASLTGVPSRTIRFYQSKCALPPPDRRGRKAYYGPPHVERLELIAKLQDRGLQIRAIRNLLDQLDSGSATFEEWLGFEAQLRRPWSGDEPQLLSEKEIQAMLKGRPAGLLGNLLKGDLVERQANHYLVRSPALLNMALTLESNGIDIATAREAREILTGHLSKAASELSSYFEENLQNRLLEGRGPEEVGQLLDTLRPIALDAASLLFAREMQRALEAMLAEGRFQPSRPRGKRGPRK